MSEESEESEETDRISKFLKDHGRDLGDVRFRKTSEVNIAMLSIMQESIEKMELFFNNDKHK